MVFEILQNTGLIFSVLASAYSLFSILKDKPSIKIEIIDITKDEDFLRVKLFFQNSGKKMSSATAYRLETDGQTYKALQEIEQTIFPSGNHSISRGAPKFNDAYPLELPAGKACHFCILFKVKTFTQKDTTLVIKLVNHKKITLKINKEQVGFEI